MLYHGYDSYGYKEEEAFKTIAEQKGFEFDAPKNVSGDVLSHDSFYTEGGQELADLVEPKI